jgi:hypothetical protein
MEQVKTAIREDERKTLISDCSERLSDLRAIEDLG